MGTLIYSSVLPVGMAIIWAFVDTHGPTSGQRSRERRRSGGHRLHDTAPVYNRTK